MSAVLNYLAQYLDEAGGPVILARGRMAVGFVRINRLIDEALRDPTDGIGKPEPLRHLLAGAWSRRISEEHRLIYLVDGDDLVILQARFHYW